MHLFQTVLAMQGTTPMGPINCAFFANILVPPAAADHPAQNARPTESSMAATAHASSNSIRTPTRTVKPASTPA